MRSSFFQTFFTTSFVLMLSLASFAQTKTILISDYDGTLNNDRQVDRGTYLNYIVLFRVESRANILTPMAEGPQQVEITSQEFTRLKKYLAPEVNQQATVNRSATLANGQKIKPGDYYFSPYYSFRYYMESLDPRRNYLLETQRRAEVMASKSEIESAHWQGKMFPVLADYVSQKRLEPNTHFMVLTACGYSTEEWRQLGQYLVDTGTLNPPQEARALPVFEPRFTHNISRPEYDKFAFMKGRPPINNVTPRKIGYLRQFLIDLMRVEPEAGERHQVVFADNDQNTVREAYKLFQEFVFGGRLKADFTVINAGGPTEIEEIGKPPIATMTEKSALWERTPAELIEKLGLQNYGKVKPARKGPPTYTCEAVFSGRYNFAGGGQ